MSHSHGCSRKGKLTSEYMIWVTMKARCLNPNKKAFKNYGGRGILICESWQYFENFLTDMGERPSKAHTLDRKDNDKNYSCGKCPECIKNEWVLNCHWATRKEQARNRRSNRYLEHNGEKKTIIEWSELLGINKTTISWRLAKGKDPLAKVKTR